MCEMKIFFYIQLTWKMIFNAHAHIECTLLTSGLPQLHKDNVYIYPPQVRRLFTLCGQSKRQGNHTDSGCARNIGGRNIHVHDDVLWYTCTLRHILLVHTLYIYLYIYIYIHTYMCVHLVRKLYSSFHFLYIPKIPIF